MAPTKRNNGKLNKQKRPVNHSNRHDVAKSGKRVLKAKTSPKKLQGPQIPEPSSSNPSGRPVPPTVPEDILQSKLYDLLNAVLAYGCEYGVLEQNGNRYCVKTRPASPGPAKCIESCCKRGGAAKCIESCCNRDCNQIMRCLLKNASQGKRMPYCSKVLQRIKQGKITRKCRKCKKNGKKHGAGSGTHCKKHGAGLKPKRG